MLRVRPDGSPPADFFVRYPADHPQAGEIVSRAAVCHCGRSYTQQLLSEAFLSAARFRARRAGRDAPIDRALPTDHYVPTECPGCERRRLEADYALRSAGGLR